MHRILREPDEDGKEYISTYGTLLLERLRTAQTHERRAAVLEDIRGEFINTVVLDEFLSGEITEASSGLFREALEDPDVRERMKEFFNEPSLDPREGAKRIAAAFTENHDLISDDVLVVILEKHVERFRSKRQHFEQNILPTVRREVQMQLEMAIQRGALPISRDRLRRLDEELVILYTDYFEHLSEMLGEWTPDRNQIRISERTPERLLNKVLTHELLHALSGRTVLDRQINFSGVIDEDDIGFVSHIRSGLGFKIGKRGKDTKGVKERFLWLDEALTERMVMEINDLDDSDSYKEYRRLLDLFLQKGKESEDPVSLETMKRAYFEDYKPEDPGRLTAWKDFWSSVGKRYDKRFLVRLDTFIEKNGIKKALEVMETDWQSI